MKTETLSEKEILEIIRADSEIMAVLKAAKKLNLPDWWIGAGFVRNKIWDYISGYENRTEKDIDMIFFNKDDVSKETEKIYEAKLREIYPGPLWTVKNSARMHLVSGDGFEPYKDCFDCFSHWTETVTCVAVKLDENNELVLKATFGLDDIINMEVRPNTLYPSPNTYAKRIKQKDWKEIWPNLKFFDFKGNEIAKEDLHKFE